MKGVCTRDVTTFLRRRSECVSLGNLDRLVLNGQLIINALSSGGADVQQRDSQTDIVAQFAC